MTELTYWGNIKHILNVEGKEIKVYSINEYHIIYGTLHRSKYGTIQYKYIHKNTVTSPRFLLYFLHIHTMTRLQKILMSSHESLLEPVVVITTHNQSNLLKELHFNKKGPIYFRLTNIAVLYYIILHQTAPNGKLTSEPFSKFSHFKLFFLKN